MSETTESQKSRLTRQQNWQTGMETILEKLKYDAKSITAADARSLADSAAAGDEQTAQIVAAVEDIASRNKRNQAITNEKSSTSPSIEDTRVIPERVIEKLRTDPASISTEDARRFSENVEARDAKSARLISAVESLAAVREDLDGSDAPLGQTPHTSLLTVVRDLCAAVDTSPEDVNIEILKTTQGIVSKMQKAIGHTNAPHPELEAELQQEYAQILPKVRRGTVSKAEADHLHSLEARTHGHTERGGLAATAQSVAAKYERQLYTPQEQTEHYRADYEISSSDVIVTTTQMDFNKTTSPAAITRRNQSLSDQTNTSRVPIDQYLEGYPQLLTGVVADLPIRYKEKSSERGSVVSHAHASNTGHENFSRHKREKSQV